jgi:hypothetical protein
LRRRARWRKPGAVRGDRDQGTGQVAKALR